MSPHLQRYLQALRDYCSQVTVLGWGLHPPARLFNLDHVYVEAEDSVEPLLPHDWDSVFREPWIRDD